MNFLIGGRMGDAIHQLYVVKNTPGKHDIYITDRRDLHSDGFIYPLDKTVEELFWVLFNQEYVNSVQAYKDEEVINLNLWRTKAYSASWTNLLSEMFNVPINGEPWIKMPECFLEYEEKLIHKSVHFARKGDWGKVNADGGVDIGNEFKTLYSLFIRIKYCKLFIGEQSLPLAVAHSLDVPRIAVLNEVDKAAYIGEEKIYSNFSYVL